MILDCKSVADKIIEEVKEEVNSLKEIGITPKLAIVRVIGDEASESYVKNKEKCAKERVGMDCEIFEYPEDVEMEELMMGIEMLNADPNTNAIILQLPLPKHLDEDVLVNAIVPHKDVDCLSISSVGSLFTGNDIVQPCTPKGIIDIFDYHNIDLTGKDVLVINRSMLVGKPLVELLQRKNATVTLAHSKTMHINNLIMEADIIITAVGKLNFISKELLDNLDGINSSFNFPKTIFVDVAINRNEDEKLQGDLENNNTLNREVIADYKNILITPVPSGVGLTTVAALMHNTVRLTKMQLAMFM